VILTGTLAISGCKGTSEATLSEESNVQQEVNVEDTSSVEVKVAKKKLPCKTSSPPIKDKSKLKKMLMANGRITPDMSDEMANKVVRDYIKKKRDAYKRCKK